jgi:peptidoglycan hydrolase-like protein with peptidoglycan-binding domain
MKRTLIALFATAALALPAAAQQQDPKQNTDQSTSQNQNTGQDQNAGQNTPDPSMDKQGGGSISLTRAQTRMLQQALNSGGLNAGPADGIMGDKTKQALQKYQSQKGLNASGQVDRQTMAALLSERGRQTASRKGQGMSSQPQGQQGSRQ